MGLGVCFMCRICHLLHLHHFKSLFVVRFVVDYVSLCFVCLLGLFVFTSLTLFSSMSVIYGRCVSLIASFVICVVGFANTPPHSPPLKPKETL